MHGVCQSLHRFRLNGMNDFSFTCRLLPGKTSYQATRLVSHSHKWHHRYVKYSETTPLSQPNQVPANEWGRRRVSVEEAAFNVTRETRRILSSPFAHSGLPCVSAVGYHAERREEHEARSIFIPSPTQLRGPGPRMTGPAAAPAWVVVPVPHRDRYNLEPSVCKPLLAAIVAMVISRNDCFHSFSPSHSGFRLFRPRLRHDTCRLVNAV